MEKFCKHIEKLLAQHDYAVVPGLGGFVVQVQSARILPDRIIPPLATIAFNPLMHHADGLLAIEIARSQQISYRQAMEYIEKKIEKIQLELNATGTIQFGNLGILNRDENSAWVFTPQANADFLPSNFQLSDLFISTKESREIENQKTIVFTLPSTRMFKYAAAAMLILGLFVTTPKVNNGYRASADMTSFSFDEARQKINATAPVPKATNATNSTADSVIEPQTAEKKTENNTINIAKTKEKENFHVIVASLPTQLSAERFCKELSAKDFPQAHVLPPIKTYRVAIRSFSDKDKAIEYMENLRKSDNRFESAWVLCN